MHLAALPSMSALGREDPAVEAADRTVSSGSIRPAHELLMQAIDRGLARRLDRIIRLSDPDAPPGIRSSRLAAYQDLIQYVQLVHNVASDIAVSEIGTDGNGGGVFERTARR